MPYPSDPILIVDDEERLVASFENLLHEHGMTHTVACSNSREARTLIESQSFSVILLDLDMPYLSGLELLPIIAEHQPDAVSLVITGAADVNSAVTSMRKGASDYLVKPVDSNRLVTSVQNALGIFDLRRQNANLKRHFLKPGVENPDAFSQIVTRNTGMLAVLRYVEAVADSSQCVLITGETGVGKELVAQAVHRLSGRTGKFVAVNVAGLDDVMFSDTLFGHIKGAYTGADSKRPGMIDAAAGGTLFLDEIGDLASGAQVKLLRLLQEQEYLPLGSDTPRRTDIRIVAATNRPIAELRSGTCMRNDLYYRLAVHSVCIPPLRDRMDDIPLLVNHFLERVSTETGQNAVAAEDSFTRTLQRHSYPGNIRELEAIIRDALSTADGDVLSAEDVPSYVRTDEPEEDSGPSSHTRQEGAQGIIFPETLPTSEETLEALIIEAMRRCNSHQTIAAKFLGISRQTLNKKWAAIKGRTTP